jgi:hypothetical protein
VASTKSYSVPPLGSTRKRLPSRYFRHRFQGLLPKSASDPDLSWMTRRLPRLLRLQTDRSPNLWLDVPLSNLGQILSRVRSQFCSGNRYAGLLARTPPKNWRSASRMSHAITDCGVIWIVTSSHAANTGPTLASARAASLRYLP